MNEWHYNANGLCRLPVAAAGIWDYFQATLLPRFTSVYNGMTVVIGPAFDYNYDGHYDTPEQIQQ